jgi:hypothetical protein
MTAPVLETDISRLWFICVAVAPGNFQAVAEHQESTAEVDSLNCGSKKFVRFEVFTAVSMKLAVFWDIALCPLYEPHLVTSQKTTFFMN